MYAQMTAVKKSSELHDLDVGMRPSLQTLFGAQPIEKHEPGTAIFWEDDAAAAVYEVVEGVVRVFRILADGRRAITGFLYPGELLGVSLQDRYLYSAEAVGPVKVRRFARNRFHEEVARSPELRPQLLSCIYDEMAAAQDQMVLLARKNAEERVCSLLQVIAEKSGGSRQNHVIEIPMTRLDMADYLGLTLETVSRVMSRLASSGVIEPVDRHAIVIRRPAKLAMLSGDGDGAAIPGEHHARRAVWPH